MNLKHRRHIQNLTDRELVDFYISARDEEIIGELFTRYMHLVYGVCLKYLQNREDAKDAVMQIFESLPGKMIRHDIRDFRPWLYVITKNHCLMNIRSAKTKDEKQKNFAIEQVLIMENQSEMHPVDEAASHDDANLKDCIELLKEEQKKCILMFYFNNKCYREIALNLRMDEKKVKSHLQNGKRNLKNCLEQKKHVREKEA